MSNLLDQPAHRRRYDGKTGTHTVQIVQNGNTLTGHFKGPYQSGGIEGTMNVRHILFRTKTRNVLTFRGMVDVNTMEGNFSTTLGRQWTFAGGGGAYADGGDKVGLEIGRTGSGSGCCTRHQGSGADAETDGCGTASGPGATSGADCGRRACSIPCAYRTV